MSPLTVSRCRARRLHRELLRAMDRDPGMATAMSTPLDVRLQCAGDVERAATALADHLSENNRREFGGLTVRRLRSIASESALRQVALRDQS